MEIKNQHPEDLQAKKFLDLVLKDGVAPTKAANSINVSMSDIRTKTGVWAEVRSLLERTQHLMDPEVRKKVAKGKLIELALQDQDIKVSLGAVKVLHEELGLIQKNIAQVGIQVNLLKEDPLVKAAMDTIEVDGEVVFDAEKKTFSLSPGVVPAEDESSEDSDGSICPEGAEA